MEKQWRVFKFGGSSLQNADMFKRVANILVQENDRPLAVVVSAMGGITDSLMTMGQLASQGDTLYQKELLNLKERHQTVATALLKDTEAAHFSSFLDKQIDELDDLLKAVSLAKFFSTSTADLISGYGELLSAKLLTCFLIEQQQVAAFCDARDILTVAHQEAGPVPLWEISQEKLNQWRLTHPEDLWIVTGYIACDSDGAPTTLKRNGSDYSASIFAALLEATDVTIWTDVDGVFSADPKLVVHPFIQHQLSYQEAMELAYFGAQVLHPSTMAPLVERAIPIYIGNTSNPQAKGTCIHLPTTDNPMVVKGLASIQNLSLINVEGSGMIGVPGIASRLFGSLREFQISVVMISQASSEHSICFAVPQSQVNKAKQAVEQVFTYELSHGTIQTIDVQKDCAIIAAVGDLMAHRTGVAAQFFSALAQAGINVRAIAQGASERNITAVIDDSQRAKAIQALHAGFYLSDQTLAVGIVGSGLIGKTLLAQLKDQKATLLKDFKIDLRVMGIANSKTMIHDENGIDLERWEADLGQGTTTDLHAFAKAIQSDGLPHTVLVDCSASEFVGTHYESWLKAGMHVITPNKKANSGDLAQHEKLLALKNETHAHYFYEATVGAGLPVISTLRELRRTGDSIVSIEGVLSGTMSYLFNTYDGSQPFSQVVRVARQHGFTEPHPRDDLMGMDVARKLVILGRESGLRLSLDDVDVEAVMPTSLANEDDVEVFLDKLAQMDDAMAEQYRRAQQTQQKMCYLGCISDTGHATVKLVAIDATHPCFGLTGSDNMIAFRSKRYCEQPLVIRGPGAGPEVTAGGVFADLLRLAAHLGARS